MASRKARKPRRGFRGRRRNPAADPKKYAILRKVRGGARAFSVAYLDGVTAGGGPIYRAVKSNLTQAEAAAELARLQSQFPINVDPTPAEMRDVVRRLTRGRGGRRNPGAISESKALRELMWDVHIAEQAFLTGQAKKGAATLERVRFGMARLALQAERGVHANPMLGVIGNPPRRGKRNPPGDAVQTFGERVYEIRYRHADDKRNYYHPCGARSRLTALRDGRLVIWNVDGSPCWKDFPDPPGKR